MEERSLADPAPPEDEQAKVTASQYAAGVRPGRARVKIRHNLDLYPRLQELADEIEAAPEDENVDDLIDEYEATRARMETVYVIENRSPEWVREAYKRAAEAMNLPKDARKRDETNEAQLVEVSWRIMAEQIVEPSEVTWESLRDLAESGAVDVDGRRADDALAAAVQDLRAGRYEAMALDFSQRRSTTRRKRRSSTR